MDDGFVIGKDAYFDIVFLRFCVRTSSLRNFVGVKMFPGICIRISMKFLAFFFHSWKEQESVEKEADLNPDNLCQRKIKVYNILSRYKNLRIVYRL